MSSVPQVDLFYGMLMIAMTLLLCTTTVSNSALMWCVEEDLQVGAQTAASSVSQTSRAHLFHHTVLLLNIAASLATAPPDE